MGDTMKKTSFATVACALLVSACAETTTTTTSGASSDPITQAISGKRLVADRGDYLDVGANGSVTGMVGPDQTVSLEGAWQIRNGQWCRTLTKPAQLAGTSCQDATLNGDGTVTIDGANGPIVWAIQ